MAATWTGCPTEDGPGPGIGARDKENLFEKDPEFNPQSAAYHAPYVGVDLHVNLLEILRAHASVSALMAVADLDVEGIGPGLNANAGFSLIVWRGLGLGLRFDYTRYSIKDSVSDSKTTDAYRTLSLVVGYAYPNCSPCPRVRSR